MPTHFQLPATFKSTVLSVKISSSYNIMVRRRGLRFRDEEVHAQITAVNSDSSELDELESVLQSTQDSEPEEADDSDVSMSSAVEVQARAETSTDQPPPSSTSSHSINSSERGILSPSLLLASTPESRDPLVNQIIQEFQKMKEDLLKEVHELKKDQERSKDNGQTRKRRRQKVPVPIECSNAVHTTYRELIKEDFNGFDISEGCSVQSQHNQAVIKTLVKEVRCNNGKERWTKAVISEGCARYFRSLRDDGTRKTNGKLAQHRSRTKLHARKQRKRERRLKALETMIVQTRQRRRPELFFRIFNTIVVKNQSRKVTGVGRNA
ncbi:uncharacterized protein [Ptychodera flava]|uniref:uncharacterized protein n=1 Tax=Ptychodera flava TaxID=63121 RepID=UPI00396A8689